MGSRRLGPTLHVEGFRCCEILGPSTRHVSLVPRPGYEAIGMYRLYACARLVGDITAHALKASCVRVPDGARNLTRPPFVLYRC